MRTDSPYVVLISIAAGVAFCVIARVLVLQCMRRHYPAIVAAYEDKNDAIRVWYIGLKAKLKIVVVFEQIVSRFPEMFSFIDYPQLYTRVSESISEIFSLEFMMTTVPFECLHYSNHNHYYDMLFTKTAGPIGVVVLGALYYAARKCRLQMLQIDTTELEERKKKLHDRCMEAFFTFTYVVFVPASMATFPFFVCDNLDNGEAYLRVDYSTQCYTDEWMLHLIYAVAMILVFPIGIPLLYFFFLWQQRQLLDPIVPSTGKRGRMTEDKQDTLTAIALREQDAALVPLSFLFEAYEPQYW